MVISCPECSTRFRVDETKIPAQGAKIRCARCKHIFAVAPPAVEPEPAVEEPLPEEFNFKPAPPIPEKKPAKADSDFGFDDFEAPEVGAGANDDFDPAALDGQASDEEDDDFSFGDDYGNVSLGDTQDETEDEPFSFGEPAPKPEKTAPPPKQDDFSFSAARQQSPEKSDPLASSFQEDASLEDFSAPATDDSFAFADNDLPRPAKKQGRSPLSIVILFILVLFLAILVAGGILVWQNGASSVEHLLASLTGQPQVSENQGNIRLSNLQGSFITNRKEGELFVIRGIAINERKEAQAAIQVKGIIFDKAGTQLLQKTIFCGNPISDSDLRKLPYSKMEEMMGNQFGESLANLNVTPGQSIPFTIIFRKLPKTLSEFVVEVVDSKPAAQ